MKSQNNNRIEKTIINLPALLLLFLLVGCNQFNPDGINGGQNVSSADTTGDITDSTGDMTDSRISNSATLGWTAPSAREDESALYMSEIAGYRIYVGPTSRNYQQQVNINDANADVLPLDKIIERAGTYYLAITTVDTSGRESAYSEEVIITV